ncbi:BPSS1780 family membrane protein [soil metagenome]
MKLQIVPARQGAQWVRRGFAVFFKQPMAFAGLFAAFLFAVFLLLLVPLVGAIAMLALLPLASLGFMLGTRIALEGRFPTPAAFVTPLRASKGQRIALVKLGLLYAAAIFAIIWVGNLIDGDAVDALMSAMSASDATPDSIAEKTLDPRLYTGGLTRLCLLGLLSIPFWHAPALVFWGSQSWAKSLFFSTMACWRNRGAFAVYTLVWIGVIMLFALVTDQIVAMTGQEELIKVAAVPAILILATVFRTSLYFTFADCFQADAPAALPAPVPVA